MTVTVVVGHPAQKLARSSSFAGVLVVGEGDIVR